MHLDVANVDHNALHCDFSDVVNDVVIQLHYVLINDVRVRCWYDSLLVGH